MNYYDRTNLTLGEFAEELSQLPLISDDLYPEFYDIKINYEADKKIY